jgi:hypothetical protein
VLLGRRRRPRLERVEVGLDGADDPPARAVDRQRLVLDHRVQPARGPLGIQARRVAHQDLQRALVGVVRVVGAQRVAPRDPQQRIGLRADQPQHELLRPIAIDPPHALGHDDLLRLLTTGPHS